MGIAAADSTISAETNRQQERKVLALEALSNLSDQFARDPDMQALIDAVVLTLAGQFAVTGALIVSRSNGLNADEVLSSATGRLKGVQVRPAYLSTIAQIHDTLTNPRPVHIDELALEGDADTVIHELRVAGVRMCIPLLANGSTFGAVFVGPRVGNLQFSEADLFLLRHFVNTITPLLANSLLYADMAALNARHAQILDSVRQAMFVFGCAGTMLLANRAASSLRASLGGAKVAPLEAGLTIQEVFPNDLFPGWAERLNGLQFTPSMRLPTTMCAKGPDGDRVFSVSIRPGIVFSALEKGVIVTLDDKTEELNVEHRMFELEKFAEQGVMASSIAHELNNHLGMVLGGVELASVANEKGNHSKVSTTLAKLKESITRMERFTAGLMDYARVNPQKQDSDINAVLSDVVTFASVQKRFSSVSLLTNLAPQVPLIRIDRDQIAQVIINVLNNAADAIKETGRRDGVVIVSTLMHNEELVLSVSDNGKGMPPEVRNKLFKTHLTTKPKGHGYGLTTCAKILDHHGATIRIESEVGFGTTFRFTFPVS